MGGIGRIITDSVASIPRQLRSLAIVVPVVCLLVAAVLIAVGLQNKVPPQFLVRDPSQTAKYPFYIGMISYLGIIAWCSAAAIGIFCGVLTTRPALRWFLLTGGGLSALLGVDDLLTMHEMMFPDYLGISENTVLAVYGILTAAFLLGFALVILRQTEFLLLGLALAFFASSEVIDQGFLNQGLNYLLDDGLKLFGITLWATYIIRSSAGALRPLATPVTAAPTPQLARDIDHAATMTAVGTVSSGSAATGATRDR